MWHLNRDELDIVLGEDSAFSQGETTTETKTTWPSGIAIHLPEDKKPTERRHSWRENKRAFATASVHKGTGLAAAESCEIKETTEGGGGWVDNHMM